MIRKTSGALVVATGLLLAACGAQEQSSRGGAKRSASIKGSTMAQVPLVIWWKALITIILA